MTGENRIPDDPREWLARAKSSLCLAGMDVDGVLYEDLCYQAQQAAEKGIKAVFIGCDRMLRIRFHKRGRGGACKY
jgi:HEPN domain-containing protein